MAVWTRLTAGIAALGIGRAGAAAIEPVMEPLKQDAWKQSQTRVLGLGELAAMVAQGLATVEQATDSAARHGFSPNRLRALAQLALTVPGVGELLRTLDRGTITPEQFDHALAKHQIEPQFWDAIRDLANDKLDPVQLANAIHRGLIDDPGLLAVPPPSGTGNVPAYPTYDVPPLEEAAAAGIDRDRLGVLVGLTGLPMGPHEAAQAVFRNILTEVDFQRAVAESNTRNEWGDAIKEQSRQIPTARDFLENALRGYRTLTAAIRGAQLHGMSPEHATMLYQNQGRPMNVRQITQALARGGKFQPEPGEITDPYRASIVEGNLKPGYYDLADALKYTMPSPFAIRQLATSGVWGYEKTRDRLLWLGWEPGDAADVAKAWTGGTTATASPAVKSEQSRLRTAAHKSYVARESDDAAATTALEVAGVANADVEAILAIWQAERALIRAQLSPADVRKAWQQGDINDATKAAWTQDEARAALIDRGWSVEQANDYMNIPYKG